MLFNLDHNTKFSDCNKIYLGHLNSFLISIETKSFGLIDMAHSCNFGRLTVPDEPANFEDHLDLCLDFQCGGYHCGVVRERKSTDCQERAN